MRKNDDLISRQAAIDAILHNQEVYSNNFGDDPIDKYTTAIISNDVQTIGQLPSAQQWIPVKWHEITDEEREDEGYPKDWVAVFDSEMPFDGQKILVTTRWESVAQDECYADGEYALDSGWDWIDDVIAWMPLPKPYKGVTE